MKTVEKAGNLHISVSDLEYDIYVGKDVIRALGVPKHVCVLKGKDKQSIAIVPCRGKYPLSFAVPDDCLTNENRKLRIHSIPFVDELLRANNLESGKTHSITGVYSSRINAVVFPLKVL